MMSLLSFSLNCLTSSMCTCLRHSCQCFSAAHCLLVSSHLGSRLHTISHRLKKSSHSGPFPTWPSCRSSWSVSSHKINMCIRSYVANRTRCARCRGSRSTQLPVLCGVLKGSVIFLLYTAGLYAHLYADDTKDIRLLLTGDTDSLLNPAADCVAAVADWMRSNRLQLNTSKTKARRQNQLPLPDSLAVDFDLVTCQPRLRSCYNVDARHSDLFASRHLRSIRRPSVSNGVLQSLVVALVFSRLRLLPAPVCRTPLHC